MNKSWWAAAFGIVGGLLGAGLLFLVSRPPRGEAITLLPPPTPRPLVVHVAGAVLRPGVYALPPSSRVQDAIQAAGGLASDADGRGLNLAAFLEDGERIFIPSSVAAPTASPGSASDSGGQPAASPGRADTVQLLININTATLAELESLPEIGPVTAQAIITYRSEHGPFRTIEAIDAVPGIGPATFDAIKDLITVGEVP
jgi:competence protein ComEA